MTIQDGLILEELLRHFSQSRTIDSQLSFGKVLVFGVSVKIASNLSCVEELEVVAVGVCCSVLSSTWFWAMDFSFVPKEPLKNLEIMQ